MKKIFLSLIFLIILSFFINLLTHWESILWIFDSITSKEYDNAYTVLNSIVSNFSLMECHIIEHLDGKSTELYSNDNLSKKAHHLHQILSDSSVTAISKNEFQADNSNKKLTIDLNYSGISPSLGKRSVYIYIYDDQIRFEIIHQQINDLDSLSIKRIFYPEFIQYRYFELNKKGG